MRTSSLVFVFGALTISAPCFAATDVPVAPAPVAGSSDYRFLKIEKEHPGFGGMFSDENGALNVYMLHPETGAAAVETDLRRSGFLTPKEAAAAINVLQGKYSFSALAGWRDRLLTALALKNVVFLDIDETRNRLVIGISDPTAIRSVKNKIIASKIPQEAVIIEKAEPIHNFETVNDKIRPLKGGVEIQSDLYDCTLGFNAVLDGIPGFVTNYHCTDKPGEHENTPFYQPVIATANAIGSELKDPPFLKTIPCPSVYNKGCRYSDSAFVDYYSGDDLKLGTIAKLDKVGSHTINPSSPMYTINGEDCGDKGTRVEKVGNRTGWTTGTVDKTCVALAKGDEPGRLMLPCQNTVVSSGGAVIADHGDSGSPVFKDNGNGTVTLAGILWGGSGEPSGSASFYYSCIGSVRADLGYQLITYDHPPGVPMITRVEFPPSISGDSVPVTGAVAFSDSNAGINVAQFDVVQDDCGGCFQSFGFDPGVRDLKEGTFNFNMWCQGDFTWTMELHLEDLEGHKSDPYIFHIACISTAARGSSAQFVGEKHGGGF